MILKVKFIDPNHEKGNEGKSDDGGDKSHPGASSDFHIQNNNNNNNHQHNNNNNFWRKTLKQYKVCKNIYIKFDDQQIIMPPWSFWPFSNSC